MGWVAKFRLCAAILALSLGATSVGQETTTGFPDIWINSGVHSANTPQIWKAMHIDTGDPWAPGAPWQTVLGRVKAISEVPRGSIDKI